MYCVCLTYGCNHNGDDNIADHSPQIIIIIIIIIIIMSDIPGNHDVKELQKTAILGTAHILRKVLT